MRLRDGITMAAVGFGMLLIGLTVGASVREGAMVSAQIARADVDKKVIAWIIKRNPDASIKDFDGFPQYLLAESAKVGMDFRFVMAIIDKESEWKPTAVSPAGAIGLMQLMPPTAKAMVDTLKAEGYEAPVVSRGSGKQYGSLGSLGDPRWNVRLGLTYLRFQIDAYGLGAEALRAYNRGPSRARLDWNGDRYAEDVSFRFVKLVHHITP